MSLWGSNEKIMKFKQKLLETYLKKNIVLLGFHLSDLTQPINFIIYDLLWENTLFLYIL